MVERIISIGLGIFMFVLGIGLGWGIRLKAIEIDPIIGMCTYLLILVGIVTVVVAVPQKTNS